MWPFTKKEKPGVLKVLLDIRSSSVGGALLIQSENKSPLIIYSTRQYVYLDNIDDSATFVKTIMNCLGKVLDNLEKEGIKKNAHKFSENHVSEVLCTVSSPWYKSRIKNFELNNKEPVKFTKDLFNKILNQEKGLEKAAKGEVIIDKKILSVYMNGYDVIDPFNKKAKDISVSFYSGIISKNTEIDIKKRITDKFHTDNINIFTHPLVILSVIRSIFHSASNFLLVDVGGETTDIGLFRDSRLHDLVTIPKGVNHFVRKIMSEYSIDLNAALSHINLLYDEKLDQQITEKSKKILGELKNSWIQEIKKILESKWQKEITPPTIFLTADNETKLLIKDLVLSKDFYIQCLKINREPILHIINNSNVSNLCDFDEGAAKDPILSVLAHFSTIKNN